MEIEAPFVARKAKAGQFIIFRVDDKSERVPLTIAGYDREKGTVAIIFQKVGLSTELLGAMRPRSGRSMPAMHLSVMLLPQPDAPSSASVSRSTSNLERR